MTSSPYDDLVKELRNTRPRDSGYAETANKAADAIEALRDAPAIPAEPVATKKTYLKPFRTIVELDARYADQIRDLLNTAQEMAKP